MARRVIREQLSGSPKVIRQIFLQFASDPFNWLRQRGIFCGIYKVSATRPQVSPPNLRFQTETSKCKFAPRKREIRNQKRRALFGPRIGFSDTLLRARHRKWCSKNGPNLGVSFNAKNWNLTIEIFHPNGVQRNPGSVVLHGPPRLSDPLRSSQLH
jgi:hypothetical protein